MTTMQANDSVLRADNATIYGDNNAITGNNIHVIGNNNVITGRSCTAEGYDNTITSGNWTGFDSMNAFYYSLNIALFVTVLGMSGSVLDALLSVFLFRFMLWMCRLI